MNTIYIAGNLGADPVTRFTPSGQKVTTFNVATTIRRGENTTTVWYKVTVWGDRFDKMISYLKKGSAVIVIGELQKPDIWTDKEGRQQISLEIWADAIKFSPFGKSDRANQENSSSFSGGSSQKESFGEQTFQGSNQNGYKQQNHADAEEEPLPF